MFNFIYKPAPTMEEYRADYPNDALNNKRMLSNLHFYQNKIPSRPRGAKIEQIHKEWHNDYDLLEAHHGYIQWLFPLKEESRFNHQSAVMQRHEADAIRNSPKCLARMVASLRMMLNFWGATLSPEDPNPIPDVAIVSRCEEWVDRFQNLRSHGHNNMRISRMLKCLGDVGLEHYKRPIVEFYIMNLYGESAPLAGSGCANSCKQYWVKTLRNDAERAEMESLIDALEGADWVKTRGSGSSQVLFNDSRDIGRKLAVWWPGDKVFYHGRICAVRAPVAGQTAIRHTVLYDDGDRQKHVLGTAGGHAKGREYHLLYLKLRTPDDSRESAGESTCENSFESSEAMPSDGAAPSTVEF